MSIALVRLGMGDAASDCAHASHGWVLCQIVGVLLGHGAGASLGVAGSSGLWEGAKTPMELAARVAAEAQVRGCNPF
jgi:hypothetical protein